MMASVALRISAGWLFLAVVVAPWYAQTVSAYSGSSTNGSASRDSTEPECKAPPYSDPSLIRVNPTDEELQELILEGRCYLACATEHYQVDVIFYLLLFFFLLRAIFTMSHACIVSQLQI